jgi:hypothetical protein
VARESDDDDEAADAWVLCGHIGGGGGLIYVLYEVKLAGSWTWKNYLTPLRSKDVAWRAQRVGYGEAWGAFPQIETKTVASGDSAPMAPD